MLKRALPGPASTTRGLPRWSITDFCASFGKAISLESIGTRTSLEKDASAKAGSRKFRALRPASARRRTRLLSADGVQTDSQTRVRGPIGASPGGRAADSKHAPALTDIKDARVRS